MDNDKINRLLDLYEKSCKLEDREKKKSQKFLSELESQVELEKIRMDEIIANSEEENKSIENILSNLISEAEKIKSENNE